MQEQDEEGRRGRICCDEFQPPPGPAGQRKISLRLVPNDDQSFQPSGSRHAISPIYSLFLKYLYVLRK